MGREVTEVNNNVKPCTTRTKDHYVVDGGTTYCVLDTRGLNEGSERAPLVIRMLKLAGILPDAEREVKKLLRRRSPGVDLVLLCIGAEKIRRNIAWKIYNKVYVDLCDRGLKVAVVVTQMGETDFNSEWRETCKRAAMGVVEKFPDARLMEAVPMFEKLNDRRVRECRGKILKLISEACSR